MQKVESGENGDQQAFYGIATMTRLWKLTNMLLNDFMINQMPTSCTFIYPEFQNDRAFHQIWHMK